MALIAEFDGGCFLKLKTDPPIQNRIAGARFGEISRSLDAYGSGAVRSVTPIKYIYIMDTLTRDHAEEIVSDELVKRAL